MFWVVSDHFVTAQKSMQNWSNWWHYRTSSLNKVASEFFCNKRTRSTPFDPKLMFFAFRTVSLLPESQCKTGQTGDITAKVRKIKSRRKFSPRTHPIHSIGPETHVLGCFGPFWYGMKVDAKLAELVPLSHKFAKLMFLGISDRFVTARKSM
jgi:hypothetical protein